jgi:hypothetical protein
MGLLSGVVRTAVAAATWTAVSNEVSRRQAGRWAGEDQSKAQPAYMPPPPGRYQRPMFQPYLHPANAPAVPPAGPARDDVSARLAHLQHLGDLRTQGILTEAEFEAEKRKLLST